MAYGLLFFLGQRPYPQTAIIKLQLIAASLHLKFPYLPYHVRA
jgi:hypothetical protein